MKNNSVAKIRIAVVDDEKMLLEVFSSLMRQFHYQADFFSSPMTALNSILGDPNRYQLIISDIRMPQMSGIQLAKTIRFVLPKIPIIFMTADMTDESKERALELGNVTILEKPFPLESTLKEFIPKFLENRSE